MSRYLVTGATGFLGRHLVRALLDRGADVVTLVRSEASDLPEAVVQRRGDVRDGASVEAAADFCDGVFHCAGKVSRRPEDAAELHELHVMGTKTVLDACIAKNVRRAVVASTSGTVAVGDDPDRIFREEDDAPIGLLNRWPYYRTKLFAERAALERQAAPLPGGGAFEVVSVNPTLLLGPGDVNGSSTDVVRLFLEKRIPAIPPGGVSYVDARDAATAMCLAMERGVAGRRYLVTASNVTFRELFARLARISGVRGPVLPMPRVPELARLGATFAAELATRLGVPLAIDPVSLDMANFFWYADATLAEDELGWSPRDPITTLSDTVSDLQVRGVVWPLDDRNGPSPSRSDGRPSAS